MWGDIACRAGDVGWMRLVAIDFHCPGFGGRGSLAPGEKTVGRAIALLIIGKGR